MSNFGTNKWALSAIVGVLALAGLGGYMMVDGWYQDGLRFRLEAGAGAVPVAEFFGEHTEFDKLREYTHEDLGFSFAYPRSYSLSSFQEAGSGETLRIDSRGRSGALEVHLTELDPRRTLNHRVVRQRLDTDNIGAVREVIADGAGPGLAFHAQVPVFAGTSTQIWFRKNRHLIQLRSNRAGRPLLRQVVESWRWLTDG